MSSKEFMEFLARNREAVEKADEDFQKHSREFDKKMAKILASL